MKSIDHRVPKKLTAEHRFAISDPDLLFDKRLVSRHILFEHTSREDYAKHVEGLEDSAELGTYPEETPWDEEQADDETEAAADEDATE